MPQRIHPAANHVTIMRTLDQNGGMGGYSDRKPSKLEQMRADYQKKLMKEKEEKMVHLYEENQRKAMMRLTKNGHAGNGDQYSNGTGSPTGGKSVREFFNERRRLEAAGAPVPNIDQHYKQAKGYSSPGGWSSRTGSGNSVTKGMHGNKNSAGRDRAQPLAPIQRRTSLATETTSNDNINNGNHQSNGGAPGRSGIPLRNPNPPTTVAGSENPFHSRPALIKHQPLPPTAKGRVAQGSQSQQPSSLPRYIHPVKKTAQSEHQPQQNHYQQQTIQRYPQHQQPQQQARQPQPPSGGKQGNTRVVGKPRSFAPKPTPISNESGGRNGSGKLTDFQKWQLEQNQAREERLKKLGDGAPADKPYDGTWEDPHAQRNDEDENDKENGRHRSVVNNRDRLNRLNGHLHDMSEGDDGEDDDDEDGGEDDIPEEDEDEGDEQDDDIKAQERALLEQIAAKQREMEKLRKEREQEEEEERREAALRKKREAAERARQKKLEEERRKEEERQRKQEEEDERQERKREEQRQREEEKRNREEEKRRKDEEKRRLEEDRKAAKRQAEEERRLAKKQQQQQQQQQYSARISSASDYQEYDDENNSPISTTRHPNAHDTFRARSDNAPPIDEKPVAMAGSDARFYLQAAASSDAKGSVGSLVPCRQCGRKFAQDRLKKHQDACVKANKPRKEFNAAQKRVEGTEMAKYAGKNRKADPPKKKSNWRAKHEEFIQSLRYAKKVTEYEKEGKDLRELAPPPPSQNPDLVPCPHCGRTFNETAAERHIPRCQAMKTRPPPMNTRRR